MAKSIDNSVSQFTQKVINTLGASCEGCNLRVIADQSNWEEATLKISSGSFTFREYDGGEKGVQQDAIARFYHLNYDTLCEVCAPLHQQLMNVGKNPMQKT